MPAGFEFPRGTEDRATGTATGAVVTPVEDSVVGPAKPVLWLMFTGAALMVVLACSSVAGLQVFRSADRTVPSRFSWRWGRHAPGS